MAVSSHKEATSGDTTQLSAPNMTRNSLFSGTLAGYTPATGIDEDYFFLDIRDGVNDSAESVDPGSLLRLLLKASTFNEFELRYDFDTWDEYNQGFFAGVFQSPL